MIVLAAIFAAVIVVPAISLAVIVPAVIFAAVIAPSTISSPEVARRKIGPAIVRSAAVPPATFWQAERHSADDDLGSHLSFEGIARGAHVWLRILQQPPEWAGVGRLVHAADGTVEDVW